MVQVFVKYHVAAHLTVTQFNIEDLFRFFGILTIFYIFHKDPVLFLKTYKHSSIFLKVLISLV